METTAKPPAVLYTNKETATEPLCGAYPVNSKQFLKILYLY
jgi:hypothetical protein